MSDLRLHLTTEALSTSAAFAAYRISFLVAFLALAIAGVDRLLGFVTVVPSPISNGIRTAIRIWALLPSHVWSMQALLAVGTLDPVTSVSGPPPLTLVASFSYLLVSFGLISVLQTLVFWVSTSARRSFLGNHALFLTGPLVGAAAAFLGYASVAIAMLWWS